ncbi:MAG: hypothetical protein Q9207_005599 [Kuettlingeria erythrocarpa]
MSADVEGSSWGDTAPEGSSEQALESQGGFPTEKRQSTSVKIADSIVIVQDNVFTNDKIVFDGMLTKPWKIRLPQVIDDKDHYCTLAFRLDVHPAIADPNNDDKWDNAYINIPCSYLRSEEANVAFRHTNDNREVAEEVPGNSKIQELVKERKLQVIDITYASTYHEGACIRKCRFNINQVQSFRLQIFEIPPPGREKQANGKWRASNRTYCAFGELTEQELSMKTFEIGEKFEIWFFDPDTTGVEMQEYKKLPQWQAEVIPQLPDIATPGNITFLMTRPRNNNPFDELTTNKATKEFDMASHQVYFVPEDSEKSVMRMMNAINSVWDGEHGNNSADLLRFLQGKTPWRSQKLHPEQQIAYQQLLQSEMVAFILGPPGSGKSFFLGVSIQMIAAMGQPLIVTCPSNAAVDALAKKLYEADPSLAAMRFHSLHFEKAATENGIRKQQADARRKASTEANAPSNAQPNAGEKGK